MSAVPSADQRYSFETDGYLVLESFLSPDHVARLRAALQQTIAGRRELERRGTPHVARPGEEHGRARASSAAGGLPRLDDAFCE